MLLEITPHDMMHNYFACGSVTSTVYSIWSKIKVNKKRAKTDRQKKFELQSEDHEFILVGTVTGRL